MSRSVPLPRLLVASALLLSGCAPAPPRGAPTASRIAATEARLARDSSDVAALLELGLAYRLAGRAGESLPLLERAHRLRPEEAPATLALGLGYEEAGRLTEADSLYREYLSAAPSSPLRRQVEGRLVQVHRLQLQAAAREALARETELSRNVPSPASVAVFPFLFQGADSTLRPLSLALGDLLVTDLSQTDRLTVLERLRVQELVDEANLAARGLVDPATAARAGHLLGAGRVVQGSVGGTAAQVELQAALVPVGSGASPSAPLREGDALARVLDAEKRMALDLYRAMGIELTETERERVNRRPTGNVRALLAYGLGLEAENAGDYARARSHFAAAAALDPSFEAARQHALSAERAATAGPPGNLVRQLAAGTLPSDLGAAEALVPSLGGRDAASELLGQEGIGPRGAVVRIHMQSSGGNP